MPYVVNGVIVQEPCPKCSSKNYYQALSWEECKSCGYSVNYHTGKVDEGKNGN